MFGQLRQRLHFTLRKLNEESGDGNGISDLIAWTRYINIETYLIQTVTDIYSSN